jgi:DNA helicase HerA-like ATPase
LKQLWFNLDDFERQTFKASDLAEKCTPVSAGDAETLKSSQYPPVAAGTKAPFKNTKARGLTRQLEFMKSRTVDSRFRFLVEPGNELTPTLEGTTKADLGDLIASWIGHDKPITVLDVSGLPVEVLSTIVGTLLRIIYEVLFWAGDLPVSGKQQPLLIVLEEAHVFLPDGVDSSAHRTVGRMAKEGRKYGVGLMVVTQRPGEVDRTVLSQCGTMVALRLTNSPDRARVVAAMPDDLGSLAALLPSLRTGEGLVIGEAMPIPSRIRFFKSPGKIQGDDPRVTDAWKKPERPDAAHYTKAVERWRAQSS